MENDPRAVFERLFGDGAVTDPAARLARTRADRSILDSVTARIADLGQRIGPKDRAKLGEYLEALRDVERRIQKAEDQNARELTVTLDQPAGIPASYEDHARLMFDMQVLAYQTDLTRVITFMIARELSGRSYPQIGVAESHHPISHHLGDPQKLASLAKINVHHTGLFAYYLEKLRATPDGDGSLLDHVMIIYGAGMADSNLHARAACRSCWRAAELVRSRADGISSIRSTRRSRTCTWRCSTSSESPASRTWATAPGRSICCRSRERSARSLWHLRK